MTLSSLTQAAARRCKFLFHKADLRMAGPTEDRRCSPSGGTDGPGNPRRARCFGGPWARSRAPVQGGFPLQSAIARELASRLADPDSAISAGAVVRNCFGGAQARVSEFLTGRGGVKILPTIVSPGNPGKGETGTGRATTGLSSTEAGLFPWSHLVSRPRLPEEQLSENKKAPPKRGFLFAGTGGQFALATCLSFSSCCSSPASYISIMMSLPPTNSPLT